MPAKVIKHAPPAFGAKLREHRKAAGLTQCELAAQVGCAQNYLSDLEIGKREPSLSLAVRIAELLGKPLQKFLEQKPIK